MAIEEVVTYWHLYNRFSDMMYSFSLRRKFDGKPSYFGIDCGNLNNSKHGSVMEIHTIRENFVRIAQGLYAPVSRL